MSKDDLHITLWYKTTPGPDKEYEAKLAKITPTKVTMTSKADRSRGRFVKEYS